MRKPPERSLLKSLAITAAAAVAAVTAAVSIALIATATDVTADTGKTAVTHEDITGIADIGNVRTPDAGTDAVPSAYIADGVYEIKNLYSGWYLDIAQDSPLTGKYVQQYSYATPPSNNSNQRWGLYKVTRVSGNDYVIRTMINNGNTFVPVSSSNGSYLHTASVPTADSSVPNSKLWTISAVDGGYIIRPKGVSSLAVCVQNNTSSGGGATNTASRLTLQNRSDSYAKWTFTKLNSSITFHGTGSHQTKHSILPGENFQYIYYMYSTKIEVNGPITYAVSQVGSYASTDVASITSSGYLTALKPGQFWLRLKITGLNDRVIVITVEKPFEGNFFIQCYNKTGVWDTDTKNAGEEIECQDINEKVNCLWRLEYQNNGYYAIRQDSSGYYVTSTSGAAKLGAKASGGFTNYQLWKLIKQDDGNYKIQSKANSSYYITEENGNHNRIDPDILVSNASAGTRQKWYLKPLTLNLTVRYDPALTTRLGSDYRNKLLAVFDNNSVGKSTKQFLLENFGIHLEILFPSSTPPYMSYPYTKNCNHRNEINTLCFDCKNLGSSNDIQNCSNGYHHKRETKFLMPSIPLEDSQYVNILFTGHKGCYSSSTTHITTGYAYAWTTAAENSIAVLSALFPWMSNNDKIVFIVSHEILHTLSASDHSGGNCIMDTASNLNVQQNLVICQSCLTTANSNKVKLYNH
mgnify:CR=1 FL=1|jgi:hypothetical protein